MATAIVTFPDVPNYSITTTLDGVTYQLQFRLSDREACFYVDLSLNDGTLLVGGVKVVCSVSLFGRYRYNPLVPQGHVMCIPPTGGSDEPPNLGELGIGRRCFLAYLEYADVGG
jgi:hypothetical protein